MAAKLPIAYDVHLLPLLPATTAALIQSPAFTLALLLAGACCSKSSPNRASAALLLMLQPRLHTRSATSSAVSALEARKSPTGLHAKIGNVDCHALAPILVQEAAL
jgi:hypothetical protein